MLKDSEFDNLINDKSYRQVTEHGLNEFAKDLVRGGFTDLKPDLSFFTKNAFAIMKSVYIRKELYYTSTTLLEKILDYEIKWDQTPASVEYICNADAINSVWMQYDKLRVNCIFQRCIYLIENPSYRTLVKKYSTITEDKNIRLYQIRDDLKLLHEDTIRSIQTKGMYDTWLKVNGEIMWRRDGNKISNAMLEKSFTGNLGSLPEATTDQKKIMNNNKISEENES